MTAVTGRTRHIRGPLLATLVMVAATTTLLWPLVRLALTQPTGHHQLTPLSAQGGVLLHTLLVGTAQASLVTVLATILAGLQTRPGRWRGVLHWACQVPMLLPPFTMALGLIVVAGHNGVLSRLLGLGVPAVYGPAGMVVAGTLTLLPFGYLLMLLAHDRIDQGLIDQARSLGLDARHTRRRVVLPRLVPAMAGTWLMAFAEAITDLANPLVLGGGYTVLASRVHVAVNAEYDLPTAARTALLLALPAMAAVLVARMALEGVQRRRTLAPVLPRAGDDPAPLWQVALAWLVVGVQGVLGSAVVVGALVRSVGTDHRPTSSHLAQVLHGPQTPALGMSLVLSLLALPLATVLAMALAWAARQPTPDNNRPAAALRTVLAVVGAAPGVLVGLAGFVWVLTLRPGGDGGWMRSFSTGAAVAIVVVHVARTVPGLVEAQLTVLDSEGQRVDEAARTLGAGPSGRARLWFPAVVPVLVLALLAAFARTLPAVSSVVFLTNSQVPLLGVRALVEADAGRVGPACAMAVALTAVVGIAAVACLPLRAPRRSS